MRELTNEEQSNKDNFLKKQKLSAIISVITASALMITITLIGGSTPVSAFIGISVAFAITIYATRKFKNELVKYGEEHNLY